jgi:hypothetical protein
MSSKKIIYSGSIFNINFNLYSFEEINFKESKESILNNFEDQYKKKLIKVLNNNGFAECFVRGCKCVFLMLASILDIPLPLVDNKQISAFALVHLPIPQNQLSDFLFLLTQAIIVTSAFLPWILSFGQSLRAILSHSFPVKIAA